MCFSGFVHFIHERKQQFIYVCWFVALKADEMVTAKELHSLAEVIQSWWEKFALTLDSRMFPLLGKLAIIKQEQDTPELRAQAMLEMWLANLSDKAHRRLLIAALLERERRIEANKVFGVDVVGQVSPP